MPASLTVRRYRPGDRDRVWDLHEAALADAGTDPEAIPDPADLRDVTGAYIEAGGEFLVGVVGGEVVAMGGLRPVDATTAELKRMRVAPGRQRRGHGARLLAALEDAARDRGFERVVLDTAARQSGAVAFYRANGYRETGRGRWRQFELVGFEKDL